MDAWRILYMILLYVASLQELPALHFHGETLILAKAKQTYLPVVALFLEDKSPWSSELNRVIAESGFKEPVEKEALIWPVHLSSSSEDRALEVSYHLDQCPVIVLLDPHGKEFARIPYNRQPASELADQIVCLIKGFDAVCRALRDGLSSYAEEELKSVYAQAVVLSPPYFAQLIREEGIRRGGDSFFLLEKYAELLQKQGSKNAQVKALKKALLSKDPSNKQGLHRKIALLEWKKRKEDPQLRKRSDKVVRPLLQYLSGIGKQDTEHAWEVEIHLAQFYFNHGARAEAVEHAQRAYAQAPYALQHELEELLKRWRQ